MSADEYLARPGQTLGTHLDGVAEKAESLVPADATTPDGESLKKLVSTVGHLHDIGKVTPWFQKYICERPDRPSTERETHADVGALLTFHALAAQGFSIQSSTAGFYAVLKHHGTLPNIQSAHTTWTTKEARYPLIQEKLEAIDDTAREVVADRLSKASDDEFAWSQVPISSPIAYQATLDAFDIDSEFYPLLLRIWSTLTCADKLDAAEISIDGEVQLPDPNRISFESEASGVERRLNELRTQARTDVVQRLTHQTEDRSVYTLTIPTGFGKTFAGLEAGLKVAADRGGRVIYALPYTTILDQVHGDILDQFDIDPRGERYTLHHHLADTRSRVTDNDEPLTDRTEAMYGETWQAGLVLTTFVQLFESLAGPGNTQSMKLPALQDAVIIVDEPQVLTPDWWQLVARVTSTLTRNYDATVILMTATQPRFIEASNFELEPSELVPDTESYFGFLETHERVQFHLDPSLPVGDSNGTPRSISEASDRIVNRTLKEGGTSLAVNNTIEAASRMGTAVTEALKMQSEPVLDLGEHLEEFIDQHDSAVLSAALNDDSMQGVVETFLETVARERSNHDTPVVVGTLSAALRPCDRAVLVATIRAILDETQTPLDNLPLIVSSTQLVEAGVDVSFDRVYRDFAPIPSVVQAAGRCNRSFGEDIGHVVLWQLINETSDRIPSKLVYSRQRNRLQPSTTALRTLTDGSSTSIPEAEMVTTGVQEYYKSLHGTDHHASDSDQLVRAYNEARGDDLRVASMIDETTDDVLVLQTTADADVLRRYLSARATGSYSEAQSVLQELKHLVTSVPDATADDLGTTNQVLAEMGFEAVEMETFTVLDDRERSRYDLANGGGLYEFS